MSLALVHSRARAGVFAPSVRVEVHLSGGLPATQIVGLPEAAVRESRDRVRAALLCACFEYPARRITINLAPADLPKEGGRFDLPIALGILAASGQLPLDALAGKEFLGELALTGELRSVDSVLPAALAASQAGHWLVIPESNGAEAAIAGCCEAYTARTLLEVCAGLCGKTLLSAAQRFEVKADVLHDIPDISDVRGQEEARRVLEIAAAGGHHLLLIGSPGCGKTLLASRLPGLLPPASEQEALESASIASVSGHDLNLTHWRRRPYRAPHHSASAVALIGGGVQARPGEISLAHNGVLFMDELPEWQRKTLEALREPMESGVVTIARATRSVDYPARFQLVAAMNPCPCGWAGDSSGRCQCGVDAIRRYRRRISGPLLDRIDLQLEIPRLAPQLLRPSTPRGEHSVTVRRRVTDSRTLQYNRQAGLNAHLGQAATERHCCLDVTDQQLLERAIEQLQLSARSMQRILRVARTIADLDGSTLITSMHLHEAIGYRRFDRTAFGIA